MRRLMTLSRYVFLVSFLASGCGSAGSRDHEMRLAGAGGESSGRFDAGSLASGAGAQNLEEITPNGRDAGPCERVVDLTAVTLGEPPPFDVVIVADHSGSLSWSRDDLSRGLKSLLTDVRGRAVRFFVLTPTQYGASSAQAVSYSSGRELVAWRDPISGNAYSNAMTEYQLTCMDPAGETMDCPAEAPATDDFKASGEWVFRMPEAVASITASMSDAEVQAQGDALEAAILGLGGTGAPEEQPLCTLNRYILQDADTLPDHAVFLVISDEDDVTTSRECLARYSFERTTGLNENALESCTANCDRYSYSVRRPGAVQRRLAFTCVPVDDLGQSHPELGTDETLTLGGGACTGAERAECNTQELSIAANRCSRGFSVEPCTRVCETSQGNTYCSLQRDDDSTNLCTDSFEESGVTYANLADYCAQTAGNDSEGEPWSNCQISGYKTAPKVLPSVTENTLSLLSAPSTPIMAQRFRTKADEVFGADGYFTALIGFAPSFDCTLRAGQSPVSNLKLLLTSDADLFPICGDYGDALASIQNFADYLIQSDFTLALDDGEVIDGIVVRERDGSARPLSGSQYTHDPARRSLTVIPGALTTADASLEVSVSSPCEGPAR